MPAPKRYALFTYDKYYPGGGWSDFIGTFNTIKQAKKASLKNKYKGFTSHCDFYDIVDLQKGERVEMGCVVDIKGGV